MNIIPRDIYKYKIIYANTEHVSKKGNKSIHIALEITDASGEKYKVHEYFTHTNDPKTGLPYEFITRKKKEMLDSIGKPQLKDKELTNDDLLDGEGHAAIKTAEDANFPPSLKVEQFITSAQREKSKAIAEGALRDIKYSQTPNKEDQKEALTSASQPNVPDFTDDDIPF